jgi:hypothetical protein
VEVLKASVNRRRRDTAPKPPQPFRQLREGKTITALVVGEDGKDADGQLDELGILCHRTGIGCQRGSECPPRDQPLAYREILTLVIQQVRLPLDAMRIGLRPGGGQLARRSILSPG